MVAVAPTSVTRLFAEWSCAQAETTPPDALLDVFRRRLLDFSANVVGGATVPALEGLRAYGRPGSGPVHAPGKRTLDADAAALVYAATAHALECDDTHQPSSTHPGTVVFGASLPLAVELGATLERVARATVVGYEVMCRLGEAAGPVEQYSRGFHPTGTCGAFGAAAAAGVLLGLDSAQCSAALGLAASVASGSMSFLEGGGASKLLNAGHAAAAGITAARLAALGIEGPDDSIRRPHGFLAGHTGDEHAVARLAPPSEGTVLAIERTSTKAHGCCRYEQGPIDAILALRAAHGFDFRDVERVDVGMLTAGWEIVAVPEREKRRPRTVVESQFSMPFGAALALVHGRAAPSDHNEANLVDQQIQQLMDRVECHLDPELDAVYPERWPATVAIALRDGQVLEQRIDFPKGDPENPFTDSELLEKVTMLAPAVSDTDVATLAAIVLESDLESTPAAALTDLFVSMWSSAETHDQAS